MATLDTQYANQIVALGDTINLDVSTNWSDDITTSYTAINLPPGLAISTTGTITGDIALGGVIGTTIKVTGTNGTKSSAGFTWYVS